MDRSFWRRKRVFLTGHTGFKGGWLTLWLHLLGAEVVGYALAPPTHPCLFEVARVSEGIITIKGDVRNLEQLQQAVSHSQAEILFHLAAQPLVRESYKNPVDTYTTNVIGTVNLLEAVRQAISVKAVVNVTSDKCYENREWSWGYRENDALGGYDPYSSSKGCAEFVSTAYRDSFFHPQHYSEHGVAIATARAGNVIGGGDWAQDRLVPDILRAFMAGKTVSIRNPHAIRPWQHVLEPLHGYLLLAEKLYTHGPLYGEAWNFGPDDSDMKAVSWVVEQLIALRDDGAASWIHDQSYHPHETSILKLDCSKTRAKLGWQTTLNLNTALSWIVEWANAFQTGADMRSVTMNQIRRFMELAPV